MRWEFTEMSRSAADTISKWQYEEPYDFYDMSLDAEDLSQFMTQDAWRFGDLGEERFVAVNADGQLAGFFSYAGSPRLCTIGLGLAPELTGRSLGEEFVEAGLAFARERWAVSKFRLEVASFNDRAIKVYERVGFTRQRVLERKSGGELVKFDEMVL
jgi:ribosomal-protein-alanine N-acetyltransferase